MTVSHRKELKSRKLEQLDLSGSFFCHATEFETPYRNDGQTHLAHKAEHAVDLETGAIVAVTVQPASDGDTTTRQDTLIGAAEQIEAVVPDGRPKELVADKGYHSNQAPVDTNATGDYTISALHPGAYTVQAAHVGYRTKEQGAVVNENATTTANISLDLAPAGPVLYAYVALGRLIQVTDPSGDSAIYHYDTVGNITAIDRPASGSVSISGFTPTTGAVGTTVTLYGTGFSSTPGQNTVAFVCGVSCTVNATVGDTTVTLYAVPADTTGSVAINGSSVPVSLTPGQNGSLTFTGTQNQRVAVHVTGNTMGSVTVKLLSSDGQTVLAQALSGSTNFDLLPATLPTLGTATYTITIDPQSANAGTLNINVTGS
jgi:YD repeat-containing protein